MKIDLDEVKAFGAEVLKACQVLETLGAMLATQFNGNGKHVPQRAQATVMAALPVKGRLEGKPVQDRRPGKQPRDKPCKHCGELFASSGLPKHEPSCRGRRRKGRLKKERVTAEPTKKTVRRRAIPFEVRDREFENTTQRLAILITLQRAEPDELTTESIAVAIAEHGYPFEVSDTSNIVEPISTMLYKMKVDGLVKARIVAGAMSSGRRLGRMALWSLTAKGRATLSSERGVPNE